MKRTALVALATLLSVACAMVLGASVALHPIAPFVLAAALGVAIAAVSSPFGLLIAFMGVLFTRPAEFFPALSVLSLAKVMSLGSLGYFVVVRLFTRDLRVAKTPHNFWLAWLVFAVIVSAQLGTDPGRSMGQITDAFVKILVLYFLILHLVASPRRAVQFTSSIVVFTAGLGAYALVMKVTGQATIEGSRAALVGFLGDPNDLAMTLLMGFPFAAERALRTKGGPRVFYGVCAFLLLAGIVSTQSRGGLLGLAAGGGIMLRDRVKNVLVVAPIVLCGLVGMIVLGGHADRQSGAVGEGHVDESAQGRLDAWGAGVRMLLHNPVSGVGYNRFAQNYERYALNPAIWGEHETHNAYIKCMSEVGLFGFIPFMALVLRSLYVTYRLRRAREHLTPRPAEDALVRAGMPCLVGFLVTTIFLSATWHWFLYIMLAQCAAWERIWLAEPREQQPSPTPEARGGALGRVRSEE